MMEDEEAVVLALTERVEKRKGRKDGVAHKGRNAQLRKHIQHGRSQQKGKPLEGEQEEEEEQGVVGCSKTSVRSATAENGDAAAALTRSSSNDLSRSGGTTPSSSSSAGRAKLPELHGTSALAPEHGLLSDVVAARAKFPQNEKLRCLQEVMEIRAFEEYEEVHHLSKFLNSLLKQGVAGQPSNPIQAMVRALETKAVE